METSEGRIGDYEEGQPGTDGTPNEAGGCCVEGDSFYQSSNEEEELSLEEKMVLRRIEMKKKKEKWMKEERRLARYFARSLLVVVKGVWLGLAVRGAAARWRRNAWAHMGRMRWCYVLDRVVHSRRCGGTAMAVDRLVGAMCVINEEAKALCVLYEKARIWYDEATVKFARQPLWMTREAFPEGLTWKEFRPSERPKESIIRRTNLRCVLLVAWLAMLYVTTTEFETNEYCGTVWNTPRMGKKQREFEWSRVRELGSFIRTTMRTSARYRLKLEKKRELMGNTGELDVG